MICTHLRPVAGGRIYQLFNLAALPVVSAGHEGDFDMMPAAWCCNLDLSPARATAVVDSSHYTRRLMEKSGCFALQIPVLEQAQTVLALGSVSKNDDAEKLAHCGAEVFTMPEFPDVPLLRGCAAWGIFRILPEPAVQEKYDLFLGEAVAAWADDRLFSEKGWTLPAEGGRRLMHYVADGQFYATGEEVTAAPKFL